MNPSDVALAPDRPYLAATPRPDGLARYQLYVGGKFTSIGNAERLHIAALSAESGAPLEWNPAADNWVMTLLAHGAVVYAGGVFRNIGGQPRNYIAALDTASGLAATWDAGIDAYTGVSQRVLALALDDTTLFVGGHFATVRGVLRRQLAAVLRAPLFQVDVAVLEENGRLDATQAGRAHRHRGVVEEIGP